MPAPPIHKRRPAETVAGTVGTVVGLLLAILQAYGNFDLDSSLMPYVPVAVGWIAAFVTWLKVRNRP